MANGLRRIACIGGTLALLSWYAPAPAAAARGPADATGPAMRAADVPPVSQRNLRDVLAALRSARYRFIPLPVIATDPAEGQTYGALPVLIALDDREEILGIFAAAGTYNTVVGFGGFATWMLTPSAREELRLFGGGSQRFYREGSVDYFNHRGLDGRLQGQTHFLYITDPFERFFGFGPGAPKAAESNFTSQWFRGWGELNYAFRPRLAAVLQMDWAKLRIDPRALQNLLDTATAYGALPEVTGAHHLIYRAGCRWESRDNQFFPTRGVQAQFLGIASHAVTGPAQPFGGYEARVKFAWQPHARFTTVGNGRWQQLFGARIPFALQSSLGGEKELRGFVARRFTDRHAVSLDLEERILVKEWHFMGTDVAFSIDPFFSVGQVFRGGDDLRLRNVEPAGGVGFRMRAMPSVLGRVDVGYSRDGFAVYTTLDYPF
ncbi:MAG: hypothetical protein HY543_09755 [Deltaproteobacteria bacterium]|nr:hypothetical protein [Deltaproteobacteria bacterium]